MGERREDPFERSENLLLELAEALKIDKHRLDDHLVEQPELYHRAGEEQESTLGFRDRAKAERDSLASHLDIEIRRTAGEKKPTEAAIKSEIGRDSEYKDLDAEYDRWSRLSARWGKLREDFHSRGFALRELAGLWIAGYYQTNSARTDEAKDRQAERVRSERRR